MNIDTLINWDNEMHRQKLYAFLRNLENRDYWVTIKTYRKNRSKDANSYYWVGVISPICIFHGYNPDIQEHRNIIHERLKKQFNSTVFEFKRRVFCFKLGNGFEEFIEVIKYLEEKDFKPEIVDKLVALPLRVVANIPERFKFGEEREVIDFESLPNTTTKLDSVEHFQYIERIRDYYASEYNLYIPEPNDKKISEFDDMYSKI